MAEIVLVRQAPEVIAECDREATRRVMFGQIDGLGQKGKRQWRRFINGLLRMEPGECVTIKTNKARNGPFHRRHMAMEQRVFEAQERFENFEQFRNWLKIGAAHCDWLPGPKGGIVPIPKSISYEAIEDDDMREFHLASVEFLRTPHAQKTLWRHLTVMARHEMVEAVMAEFGE